MSTKTKTKTKTAKPAKLAKLTKTAKPAKAVKLAKPAKSAKPAAKASASAARPDARPALYRLSHGGRAGLARRVLKAHGKVAAHDGVEPLNQDGLWAVAAWAEAASADPDHLAHEAASDEDLPPRLQADTVHAVMRTRGDSGAVAAYAQARCEGQAAVIELFVVPKHRRQGLATAVLRGLLRELRHAGVSELSLWAHGNLPEAQAFLRSAGWQAERTLFRMLRSGTQPIGVALPAGYMTRTLAQAMGGVDVATALEQGGVAAEAIDALLAVNAAAFADHPEQGALDRRGFAQRAAEPWFDAGAIHLVCKAEPDPNLPEQYKRIEGFHWVKREPGAPVAEVYVVGIAPEAQGRGLAKPLTALGVDAALASGASAVDLYVDESNARAVATYTALGFGVAMADAQYAPVA